MEYWHIAEVAAGGGALVALKNWLVGLRRTAKARTAEASAQETMRQRLIQDLLQLIHDHQRALDRLAEQARAVGDAADLQEARCRTAVLEREAELQRTLLDRSGDRLQERVRETFLVVLGVTVTEV